MLFKYISSQDIYYRLVFFEVEAVPDGHSPKTLIWALAQSVSF